MNHVRILSLVSGCMLPLVVYSNATSATQRVFQKPAIGEFTEAQKNAYITSLAETNGTVVTPKGSEPPAWEHTEHQFGFLPFTSLGENSVPIVSAHSVTPNTNLVRIDIRLDRLRVYDYPGKGRHFVVLTFVAQNTPANTTNSVEGITFSQTYEVQEGEGAGINGYPVFNGLNVGKSGASFKCATVNVKNQRDEKALAFLRSGPVSRGLTLLTTAHPAIATFTELTKGIGEMLLTRNENVKVQDFYLGLDFDAGAAFGARLVDGNYIVVQAPDSKFSWTDWVYRPSDARLINKRTSGPMPFNYIIFRVTKHAD